MRIEWVHIEYQKLSSIITRWKESGALPEIFGIACKLISRNVKIVFWEKSIDLDGWKRFIEEAKGFMVLYGQTIVNYTLYIQTQI